MLKPICVPCQRFFRPKTNGFPVIEGMPTIDGAKPGTAEPHLWKPYKLWVGDLWECQGCKAQIVVGIISHKPVAEHFQKERFAEMVEMLRAELQVNDC